MFNRTFRSCQIMGHQRKAGEAACIVGANGRDGLGAVVNGKATAGGDDEVNGCDGPG